MIKKNLFKRNIARCATVCLSLAALTGCKGSDLGSGGDYSTLSLSACVDAESPSYSGATMCAAASSSSSAASANSFYSYGTYYDYEEFNTEEYSAIQENAFYDVSSNPLSTFAADVDTASYANVRRLINSGYTLENIPEGSVRAEEMINYFTYDYKGPEGDEPFGVNAEISTCPWNEDHVLLQLGLKAEDLDFSEAPPSNIVFLIDVSGSMNSQNKLPLLKSSFIMLLDNLRDEDTVSIVTYASGVRTVLDGVKVSEKQTIVDALDNLSAGGSTNGEGGIDAAYELAEKNFIKKGNNRVILASDGDFNVGQTSDSELSKLIKKKAKKGIFLSVLGFGMGNYSDTRMETLADDGNGNYAYIDTINEAKKVLVNELGSTMFTVAKDVKLQVEFNPVYVSEYRLVGYENRVMAAKDFDDDTKDGGEIGAGHTVTVLYEIVPAGKGSGDSGLRYQTGTLTEEALESNEWLTLSVRYKAPDSDTSDCLNYYIGADNYTDAPSDDFKFAACVAEFAMVLRNSEFLADGSAEHIVETLGTLKLDDEYKREFATLADKIN
ncbi:MAG: VWA domain-containing protein [Lachnospiraceae bacterium]|nr:VWA domain-containing protein [Lachnospiraceae bacterium]